MTESEEIERLKAEIKALRDIIDEKPGKMVGNSGEMREVYKQIKKCAKNDAQVLIYGNDGTGKELTAHTIAELSARKEHPFVVMGCANLSEGFGNPANTFESELFGYESGPSSAQTAATWAKPKLQMAAHSFWTTSRHSARKARRFCCGSCKTKAFTAKEATSTCIATCA